VDYQEIFKIGSYSPINLPPTPRGQQKLQFARISEDIKKNHGHNALHHDRTGTQNQESYF